MTSIDHLVSITREMSVYVSMFMSAEGEVTNSELSGSKRYSKSSAFSFVLNINLILLQPASSILLCCTFERFENPPFCSVESSDWMCVCLCVRACVFFAVRDQHVIVSKVHSFWLGVWLTGALLPRVRSKLRQADQRNRMLYFVVLLNNRNSTSSRNTVC